jgi:hypothetical protein
MWVSRSPHGSVHTAGYMKRAKTVGLHVLNVCKVSTLLWFVCKICSMISGRWLFYTHRSVLKGHSNSLITHIFVACSFTATLSLSHAVTDSCRSAADCCLSAINLFTVTLPVAFIFTQSPNRPLHRSHLLSRTVSTRTSVIHAGIYSQSVRLKYSFIYSCAFPHTVIQSFALPQSHHQLNVHSFFHSLSPSHSQSLR